MINQINKLIQINRIIENNTKIGIAINVEILIFNIDNNVLNAPHQKIKMQIMFK